MMSSYVSVDRSHYSESMLSDELDSKPEVLLSETITVILLIILMVICVIHRAYNYIFACDLRKCTYETDLGKTGKISISIQLLAKLI